MIYLHKAVEVEVGVGVGVESVAVVADRIMNNIHSFEAVVLVVGEEEEHEDDVLDENVDEDIVVLMVAAYGSLFPLVDVMDVVVVCCIHHE